MTQNRQILSKKQKDFLKIFKNKLGIVSTACEASNVSRAMYYRWLNENKLFKEKVEEAYEGLKDFGELALLKAMQAGNPACIIFFNKSKNKDRGYIERTEIEHSGEVKNKIEMSFLEIMDLIDELDNEQ